MKRVYVSSGFFLLKSGFVAVTTIHNYNISLPNTTMEEMYHQV